MNENNYAINDQEESLNDSIISTSDKQNSFIQQQKTQPLLKQDPAPFKANSS
jgi:hypothetical protein